MSFLVELLAFARKCGIPSNHDDGGFVDYMHCLPIHRKAMENIVFNNTEEMYRQYFLYFGHEWDLAMASKPI